MESDKTIQLAMQSNSFKIVKIFFDSRLDDFRNRG